MVKICLVLCSKRIFSKYNIMCKTLHLFCKEYFALTICERTCKKDIVPSLSCISLVEGNPMKYNRTWFSFFFDGVFTCSS